MTTGTAGPTRSEQAGSGNDAPHLDELAAEVPTGVGVPARDVGGDDVVDVGGHGSFPASDPPANW